MANTLNVVALVALVGNCYALFRVVDLLWDIRAELRKVGWDHYDAARRDKP